MDLALALYEQGEWDGVLYFTGCALAITYRPRSYICEAASWGSLPHDLRSIALFHTGRLKEAREEARKAVELEPDNERLQGNLKPAGEQSERRRVTSGPHPLDGARLCFDLTFGLRLKEKGHYKAEEDSGGDTARRGGGPASEGAQKSVLRHRLFDPLGQQVAKAREGYCGARLLPSPLDAGRAPGR